MADNTEVQQPEKSENKKKKTGEKQGMSLPVVIMIILAVVIVQAVLFILIYKFVLQTPENSGEEGETTEQVEEVDPMAMPEMSELDAQEQEFIAGEEDRDFYETERITTNPLNSTKYVVIKLYLEYRAHPTLIENLPDGDKKDDKLNKEGPYMTKIVANTKAIVIEEIGKMSETEILSNKEALKDNISKALKDLFYKKKIFLREVNITEFIVQ